MAREAKMKRWQKIVLLLIVFVAFVLRFWRLSEYPVGFHIDEASLGYNAYSLLKTGRDENNDFLPLHTDMFGDFRPAGYRYLSILPVKIFGLTELATRFPSAFFGTLTVVVIFLLAREIFNRFAPAVVAAGLLAISPWHLTFSRAAAETNVALFFVVLGAYFFLFGLKRAKARPLYYSIIAWGMGMFVYHTPRVFGPMLVLALAVFLYPLWRDQKAVFKRRLGLVVAMILALALFLVFGAKGGTGRFSQVSIFHFPEIRLVLEEQIREDGYLGTSVWLTRIFHNKIVNYSLGFIKEYFRYFNPHFLFIEGGLPRWYAIPNMGLMYLVELPAFLVGLYCLVKQASRQRLFLVPVFWLVLGPVVAALTQDDVPNVLRSLVMLPALMMITGYGVWRSFVVAKRCLKPKTWYLMLLVLGLMLIWNFTYFLFQYFVHSSIHRPWYRSVGFKEMVLAVNERLPDFEKVVITKAETTYIHFLFFSPIEPAEYHQWGSPRDPDNGGFGKLIFKPGYCPVEETDDSKIDTDTLWVAFGSCPKPPFKEGKALPIYRPDKTVAFWIYPK